MRPSRILAARANVAAVIRVLVATERAEDAGLHDLGEAEDGVKRRAQLVAHLGEEFGLGAVGALGFRLLFEVALRKVGELLGLQFQRLARALQVGIIAVRRRSLSRRCSSWCFSVVMSVPTET